MAQLDFDLTEYQDSRWEQYRAQWEGCDDLSPSFWDNSVSYAAEKKEFHISVSSAYEFETMLELYDELEWRYPNAYRDEPAVEEVERWRSELQSIRGKFGALFQVQPPDPLYPHDVSERKANAFSGTEITVPLGEGLLNFCYADFASAFERCAPAYREFPLSADPPERVHSAHEGLIHIYELYAEVFAALREVFYSSLYTASFPPQFMRKTEGALEYYRRYLSLLQTEFLELLEFCFDRDYEPEVLSLLCPWERYGLWCQIKGVPVEHVRQETFDVNRFALCGAESHNTRREIVLTQAQRQFAKENGLPEHELRLRYEFPRCISVSYGCDNLRDMLYLELTKCLETGVEFQRCKRCGRYFIVKGNYRGTYCDRIAEGESRTCQQLAAQEAYLRKLKDNDGENPLNVYQKYYKRYFARVKAGSLKQEKFKLWQYEAVRKRDDCLEGRMTLAEFTDWLEASMPNRAKKKNETPTA